MSAAHFNFAARLLVPVLAIVCLAPACFAEENIPKIALSDQFDRLHRHQVPFQRPLVVVVADRRGASQIEGWVSELYQRHGQSVEIVGVADLRGVPEFMKNPLRKAFRKQCSGHSILLDWEGSATSEFSRGSSGIDIYAANPGGEIIASASGALTPAKLDRLTTALSQTGVVPAAR